MNFNQRSNRTRLIKKIEQASEFRVFLALIVLFVMRFYRRCSVWLYPWFLPERRKQRVHWVGERRQAIRPVHLLFPLALAEAFLILLIVTFTPHNALAYGFIGHLVIVAIAMSPGLLKSKSSII